MGLSFHHGLVVSIFPSHARSPGSNPGRSNTTTVAVHQLLYSSLFKDCPLTFKKHFIKGPVCKLCIKFSALYEHLPFKVQGSFKVLSSACSVLGKRPVLIWSLCRFCHATYFQSKMREKLVPGRIWTCAPVFKRFLYAKIWAKFRCEYFSFKVLVHWCCVLWKNIVGHTENKK